ncbi:MAG: response regulator [Bacteriovoracia bacterium]
MFPAEVFSNSKRAMANLQKGIVDWVKFKYKLDLKPTGATETAAKQVTEVRPFCAMRFTAMKTTTAFPVGFGSPEQEKAFFAWVAGAEKSADEMAEIQKDAEKEFCKVVYNAAEVELTDKQVKIEPNSMLAVPQKALFGWASVMVEKVVTLTFTANDKEISFVFPLFDKKFYEQKSVDSFGFATNSRMLVVDDSATSRKLSRHALNLAGYINVDECEDGEAAFKKMAGSSPQIALLVADWHMPNMSGIELLKKIRRDKELKGSPVILVTGEQNATEVTEAIKEGVNGFVVKPFQMETIYKAMKKAGTVAGALKKAA